MRLLGHVEGAGALRNECRIYHKSRRVLVVCRSVLFKRALRNFYVRMRIGFIWNSIFVFCIL